MRTQIIRAGVLGLGVLALTVAGGRNWSIAKDEPARKSEAPKADAPKVDPAAEMEAWVKMNQPGPEHKMLATFAGEWDATVTACSPDGSKAESKGKEKSVVILDGRFVESTFQGSMMGVPFTGRGLMGFDNLKKKYVMTWSDSMSTGIMVFEGSLEGKVLTMHAEQKDAAGHTEKVKSVTTIVDENHHTFEMFMVMADGKETKSMGIDYKRAGK